MKKKKKKKLHEYIYKYENIKKLKGKKKLVLNGSADDVEKHF
jgi:hypothetical protein